MKSNTRTGRTREDPQRVRARGLAGRLRRWNALYRYPALWHSLTDTQYAQVLLELIIEAGADPHRETQLLHLGCGTGRDLAWITGQCPQWTGTGVDVQPALISFAAHEHPDITFATADVCTLNLGRRYDIITTTVLPYMRNSALVNQTAATITRHLQPGGLLIIGTRQHWPGLNVENAQTPHGPVTLHSSFSGHAPHGLPITRSWKLPDGQTGQSRSMIRRFSTADVERYLCPWGFSLINSPGDGLFIFKRSELRRA